LSEKSASKRVSPIKQRPLRNPGQSLEEQLDVLLDRIIAWAIAPLVALVFAGLEWTLWVLKSPRQPAVFLAVAVIALLLAVYKIRPLWKQRRDLRLAIRGEKAVGETLDGLKRDGYRVIHDIVAPTFNIDHVLIGPTGVYMIETKTRSKYANHRDVHVKYDGQHVLVDGYAPDRDPVQQAQALADRVAELLEKTAGKRFSVRPVVVFPGWWVDPQPKGVAVWVLNDKAVADFVKHEDRVLDEPTIARLAAALEAHVRVSGRLAP
jgi:hypothetical protein